MANATPSHIHVSASHHPELSNPTTKPTPSTATQVSNLLQQNHERHHIFFNDEGFHNHIVHHLLTVYALGGENGAITHGYEDNAGYQRPAKSVDPARVEELHDPAKFKALLGPKNEASYAVFLAFFQSEMAKKGWQQVLNEYLFAGDDRADDLLVRTYSGFLHPMIHLGFGIEFEQPAIIAEALAQACVHDDWLGKFLIPTEKRAAELKQQGTKPKSLMTILAGIPEDKELVESVQWGDANKIRDGIIARAPKRMVEQGAAYFIPDDSLTQTEVERRTAEMTHFATYFTAAAQRPPRKVKFDFYYMHAVNCSIFFGAFARLPESVMTLKTKARLLEWKARVDLALYVSRHSPELLPEEIKNHPLRYPSSSPSSSADGAGVDGSLWSDLFARAVKVPDDGHSAKLLRAVAHGKQLCTRWETDQQLGFVLKGSMWDRVGEMVMDSVENLDGNEDRWIRSVGWDQAWQAISSRGSRL